MRIAVTGASGQIGGQVVRLLAGEQAHQVVALSRRVPPSGRWPAGVSARAAGYADPEALSTALRGADTLVSVSSDGPVAQVMAHHHTVIRAARASGVAHIAALSGLDADPARRSATRSATGTPSGCSPGAGAWSRSPGHRPAASSSPGSWPAPAPAARSGSPPPAAGYRWSPALTSRGAWRPSRSGPRAATTTSPARSPPAWLPSQLWRHARGAPRWSRPASRPPGTARRWLSPGRIRGGCMRTRRCSPRSGSNAGRRSPMRSAA
jgi:NAD(P)H-binding